MGRPGSRNAVRPCAAATCVALALAVAVAPPAARAVEVAGIEVPETIELGGVALRLNGAGERTLYVVRTYVAALYVAQPSMHAQALLGQPGPRRLSMTMLAALSSGWVVERLTAAMQANTSEEAFVQLQPRLARLVEAFLALERLQKGDRIDIDAVGGATRLNVAGRVAEVPGEDLFDALLRGFIGERPIDSALQHALLGRPMPKVDPGS